MPHPRKLIRDSVLSILAGASPAGWTVRKADGRPLPDITLCPCITPAIPSEPVQRGAQRKRREPQLTVTAYIAAGTGGDDLCDDASVWIEAALDADPSLGGACQDCTHIETTITPVPGGEQTVWELSLTYNLRVS
ncbi:hypothetical protein R2G56_08330 [Nitratireductor aquimarinus]|uniref:DUF3168 domain-containing protein n=1 Tax=Nitratireductor aquimarinus TaxID=889300 RepID=A0ABU4AJ75_9HYPH|nr:hypothetical protein [Nitratireductor aquimarinus]MDV6226290.1 hypothetical protein [Nitratireductor aquimarinus]